MLRQFAGVLMLVLTAGSPVMACLVPGAEMNAAERACCKHMAQQCGSMNMPSSHSCCQTAVRQSGPMLHVERADVAPQMMAAVIVTLPTINTADSFHALDAKLHPPPESPPDSSSILRI
ncbi:MAG TPA: hypothetical protein VJN64_17485 [Terriglobales bacterium]|nr:hypothetical protein [Terriglobales bacterium]